MRSDSSVRPHLYTLRLSPEEDARAKRIADYIGLPISSMMRTLLLERERALVAARELAPLGDRTREDGTYVVSPTRSIIDADLAKTRKRLGRKGACRAHEQER